MNTFQKSGITPNGKCSKHGDGTDIQQISALFYWQTKRIAQRDTWLACVHRSELANYSKSIRNLLTTANQFVTCQLR